MANGYGEEGYGAAQRGYGEERYGNGLWQAEPRNAAMVRRAARIAMASDAMAWGAMTKRAMAGGAHGYGEHRYDADKF